MFLSSVTDIRVDWETYSLEPNDHKLVDVLVSYGEHFPLKDADGNEVFSEALRLFNKTKWERAHTPVSDGPSFCHQSATVSTFNIISHRRLRCTWLNTRLLFPPAQTEFSSIDFSTKRIKRRRQLFVFLLQREISSLSTLDLTLATFQITPTASHHGKR